MDPKYLETVILSMPCACCEKEIAKNALNCPFCGHHYRDSKNLKNCSTCLTLLLIFAVLYVAAEVFLGLLAAA